MKECLFCRIVSGNEPSFPIWENDDFMAFLTPYPNTRGATVVIPRRHYPSDVFELPRDIRIALFEAATTVGSLLTRVFDDVGRTGMIVEGFGIDHAHIKLFPMHGTKFSEWKPINALNRIFSERYEGFLSSHDGPRALDSDLAALAKHICPYHGSNRS